MKLRREMPPASTRCEKSCDCSAERPRPGRSCTRRQKASSEIVSVLGFASSRKRSSRLMVRRCTSSRQAAATLAEAAEEILVQAALTEACSCTLFFSVLSTLTMTLATAVFASCSGPLDARATVPWWLVRQAFTAATSAARAAASFSLSCVTVSGVAKASSAAPSAEVSDCTASSSLLAVASIASTRSFTALRIVAAVFLSRTSCCTRRSASSFLEYSFFASATRFFMSSTFFCALLIFGLSFDSSPLASASGPWLQLASSAPFCLMKVEALAVFFAVASRTLSRDLVKEV
mmetsp:Transcript_7816/g.21198  ORF Transcript_7816/g.21198 Transcript_7816/m.21198 type:complete len:291 (-) Transcript_7816:1222-2094(-)